MIDAAALLADTRKLADRLVDDLGKRTESHDESRIHVQGVYSQATAANRTDKTFEEWREDLLAQVAAEFTAPAALADAWEFADALPPALADCLLDRRQRDPHSTALATQAPLHRHRLQGPGPRP